MTARYVLNLEDIDRTQIGLVGGKGAHLGELSRLAGIHVPAGFCVTTDAYRWITTVLSPFGDPLARLSRVDPQDRVVIRTLSAEIRQALETVAIPDPLAAAIGRSLARLGAHAACASAPARRPRICPRLPSRASRTAT